jgi:hypothetical protein
MVFDLRKFWLGTAVYIFIIGVAIAAVGGAFSALIGMPTKGYQQVVTQTAPIQAAGSKEVPVETEREVAAPGAQLRANLIVEPAPDVDLDRPPLPLSPLVRRTPAPNITAMTPPQIIMSPVPQIIVPEPTSTRRRTVSHKPSTVRVKRAHRALRPS